MAAGAMAAGAALSAVGSIRGGNAVANAAEYNAQNAEANAQESRQQASEEERRVRVQARKQIGAARANYGASGVTTEGSALDVLEESAANAELDALTVRHQGEMKARNFEQYANMERFKGREAKVAGYLGAAGSAAQGAGKFAG